MASIRALRTLSGLSVRYKALPLSFRYVPPQRSFAALRHAPTLPPKQSSSSNGLFVAAVIMILGFSSQRNNGTAWSVQGAEESEVYKHAKAYSDALCRAAKIENDESVRVAYEDQWTTVDANLKGGTVIPLIKVSNVSAGTPNVLGFVFKLDIPGGVGNYDKDWIAQFLTAIMGRYDEQGMLATPGIGACTTICEDEMSLWAYEAGVVKEVWRSSERTY